MQRQAEVVAGRGHDHDAEVLLRGALELLHRLGLDDHPRAAQVRRSLAAHLLRSARGEEGVALLRTAFESRCARFGQAHPSTRTERAWLVHALRRLAEDLRRGGEHERAVEVGREGLRFDTDPEPLPGANADRERSLLLEHVGYAFYELLRYGEAIPVLERVVTRRDAEAALSAAERADRHELLGLCLWRAGYLKRARDVLHTLDQTLGATSPRAHFVRGALASVLTDLGELDAAEQLLRRLLATPALDAQRAPLRNNLAWCLSLAERHAEAETILRELARTHPHPLVLKNLAASVRGQGRAEQARELLDRALDRAGEDALARALVATERGALERAAGSPTTALPWLERAHEAVRVPEPSSRSVAPRSRPSSRPASST